MEGNGFVETGCQLPSIEVVATFASEGQGPPRAIEPMKMIMMTFMTSLYP